MGVTKFADVKPPKQRIELHGVRSSDDEPPLVLESDIVGRMVIVSIGDQRVEVNRNTLLKSVLAV